jgi:RHH-type proline utilization regulon transcriptional repressor/proline dehydrogenase/delta 1-pyrroline-5-carboxylate dehydrogenase
VEDVRDLDLTVSAAKAGAAAWQALSAKERASVLHAAGRLLVSRRAELIETMMSEAGKTLAEADPEVSEAVDFAHYYAERSLELGSKPGAHPIPRDVTLVTPPWNFPVAIPAGSTLAALAAGSAVVLKPAEQSGRCGAVLAEALWDAGVPREVLHLVDLDPEQLGTALLSDERIDQVILTGAYETAERFLSVRPDLRLFAETSGKNSIIVTASADVDLAVRDVVASAFGHAGQKCSAASLVIAVGSVATSRRFLTQLEDAVRSIAVGPADVATTQMGPIIEPAQGKLLHALTTLEPGESWIVEPRQLDDAAHQWTPGLRTGVAPGSFFHLTECFGPVLGVMTAKTLKEAIELQNAVDYGLTAGIHSLNPAEITEWLGGVRAGNLYVNRGTTGAIVQRQPFGGWKRSVVGATFKAGGPHYLTSLTDWAPREVPEAPSAGAPAASVLHVLDAFAAPAWVRRAANADAAAWTAQFGAAVDRSGLVSEANVLRYRASDADIRWEGGDQALLARVAVARIVTGGSGVLSVAEPLAAQVTEALESAGIAVIVEDSASCVARGASRLGGRIRVAGGPAVSRFGSAAVSVFDHAVTGNPELELMPFLREQAVSVTLHRFGTHFAPIDEVVAAL